MFNSGNGLSLSDIAAVTNRNNGDFMDGNGAWWIIVILLACFGGFGNNRGWNGNQPPAGTRASYYTDAAMQRGFDNAAVMTKLEGLENSFCQQNYDILSQTSGINQNLANTGYQIQQAIQNSMAASNQNASNIQNAITQNQITAMQGNFGLQQSLCQGFNNQQAAINQMKYDNAINACAISNLINQQTQQIMQNDNGNYQKLHDQIVQNQIDAKDAKIAEQAQQIQFLTLTGQNAQQTNEIVSAINPKPVPSYTVPSPWANYFGMNNGSNCCGVA